jgi:hypothetical protein
VFLGVFVSWWQKQGGKLMRNPLTALMVIGFFVICSPLLNAQKEVGRIVGGEKGCIIERMENGALKKLPAKFEMILYPGDKLIKPNDIDSVRMDFLPYAEAKRQDESRAVIVFKPPVDKTSIFAKIRKFLGLAKVDFFDVTGASRAIDRVYLPGENATVMTGQRIIFNNPYNGKTIVFKEFRGKEIFRKNIGAKEVSLTPGDIGMESSKIYTWEIVDKAEVLYRSKIKLLSKRDEDLVKKDLKKIDDEKISADEKKVKKAAYLQLMSDLYPGEINLFWLSYQLLKDSNIKNEEAGEKAAALERRAIKYLEGGISERDFDILDSPGCVVTIEWEKNNEKRYVSPNFSFHEGESFWIHFQTNFKGYAVILYEDRGGYLVVFPVNGGGCGIEPKTDRYSHECQLDDNAGDENFIFILSEKPIKELERPQQLMNRAREQGKKLNVNFIGTKAYVTLSQKDLEGIAWFRLAMRNLGKK